MGSYEFLEVDQAGPGVCRITLNRPEKRNAINNPMRGELLADLQAADRDDAVARLDPARRRYLLLLEFTTSSPI